MNNKDLGLQTLAIHAGESPDPATAAASPNLVMSTTFIADPEAGFSIENALDDAPHVYTRWSNPTLTQLENKLAILEGAEACLTVASGMAAISALMLDQLAAGDRLIMSDVSYAGASELTNDILPKMGVEVVKVNMTDLETLKAAISPNTKLIYTESPCNPLVRLTNLKAVVEIAKPYDIPVAVDATFSSPIGLQPIDLGITYVIHSLTKYIGGHGDALGGALLGPKDDIFRIRQHINVRIGGCLSPFNAWLILRGAATLPLRMRAHQEGAMVVAKYLEAHPKVERVIYPGLPSHPQHQLAQQQLSNFSGMLTLRLANGPQAARRFAEKLQIWHYAVSLGHHRSLLFYMDTAQLLQSSFKLTAAQEQSYRTYAGDGMFRVSVGLEDPEDLCADLESVLKLL